MVGKLPLVVGLVLCYLAMVPPILADGSEIDITNYDMDIILSPYKGSMTASVNVELTSLTDGLTTLEFALNRDMTINGVYDENGKKIEYQRLDEYLEVILEQPLDINDQVTLRFDYSFSSPTNDEDFIWGYVGHEASFLIYEYRWYPMVWGDRATATIKITVPDGIMAISIGDLIDESHDKGTATFTWQSKALTRGVSIVAAQYEKKTILFVPQRTVDGFIEPLVRRGGHSQFIEVTSYLFPEDREYSDSLLDSSTDILNVLSEKFNNYPYDEFMIVEMPDFFFGGHGDQNFIMLHPDVIHQESEEFLAHEISHSWWGSLIFAEGRPSLRTTVGTRRFNPENSGSDESQNLWLHEGFATYSGALYLEEKYGRDAMLGSLSNMRSEYLNAISKNPDVPISKIEDAYDDDLYHAIVYSKGAYVLHMLRYVVGDETFFAILNTYIEQYQDKSASIADFHRICEEVAGEDLDWFFTEWIDEANLPDFSINNVIVTETPEGYNVDVMVEQLGDTVKTPLDVTLVTRSAQITQRSVIDRKINTVTFEAEEKPQSIVLNKDGGILESNTKNNVYNNNFSIGIPKLGINLGLAETIAILALAIVGVSVLFIVAKFITTNFRENYF